MSEPGTRSTGRYGGPSRGHAIASVDANADVVDLDDGSRWRAYEGYHGILQEWQTGEMITVKENRDDLYPYKLINVHHNQSVEAQFVGIFPGNEPYSPTK